MLEEIPSLMSPEHVNYISQIYSKKPPKKLMLP